MLSVYEPSCPSSLDTPLHDFSMDRTLLSQFLKVITYGNFWISMDSALLDPTLWPSSPSPAWDAFHGAFYVQPVPEIACQFSFVLSLWNNSWIQQTMKTIGFQWILFCWILHFDHWVQVRREMRFMEPFMSNQFLKSRVSLALCSHFGTILEFNKPWKPSDFGGFFSVGFKLLTFKSRSNERITVPRTTSILVVFLTKSKNCPNCLFWSWLLHQLPSQTHFEYFTIVFFSKCWKTFKF